MKRLFVFLLLALAACDEGSSAVKEPPPSPAPTAKNDGGPGPGGDGGTDAGASDCFENPKTHFEIINACTSATKITKNPVLPKLLADGGLPPLN